MNEQTETTITLNLSEYEASVVTGALDAYRATWFGKDHSGETAEYLRENVLSQLPRAWTES